MRRFGPMRFIRHRAVLRDDRNRFEDTLSCGHRVRFLRSSWEQLAAATRRCPLCDKELRGDPIRRPAPPKHYDNEGMWWTAGWMTGVGGGDETVNPFTPGVATGRAAHVVGTWGDRALLAWDAGLNAGRSPDVAAVASPSLTTSRDPR